MGPQTQAGPPNPQLVHLVRSALAHLYDYAYLQNHPLTLLLDADHSLDQVTRAQQLRRTLLDCLAALQPQGASDGVPPEATRAYAILTYRYVDGLTIEEIASRMALSRRQAYREHEKGVEAAASLLADKLPRAARLPAHPQPPASPLGAAQAEVERLRQAVHSEALRLEGVLEGVLGVVAPLAEQTGLHIRLEPSGPWPAVVADRIMLRQALVNLFSYALDGAAHGELAVTISPRQGELRLDMREACAGPARLQERGEPHEGTIGLAVSRALLEAQGGNLEVVPAGPGAPGWQAHVSLPLAARRTVLVIDDNADMVALLQRYLAGHAVAVVGATEGEQALQLARELAPQLVILDVMMPNRDGWEVLQALQGSPDTRAIPVVICSVLNERRLAQAMGASDYITKPVRQDDLLAVLRRWLGPLTTVA